MAVALGHTPRSAGDQSPAEEAAAVQVGTRREVGDAAGDSGSVLHAGGVVVVTAETTFAVGAVAGPVQGVAAPTRSATVEIAPELFAARRNCVDPPLLRHLAGEEVKGVQQGVRTGTEPNAGARRGRQVLAAGEVALIHLERERAES